MNSVLYSLVVFLFIAIKVLPRNQHSVYPSRSIEKDMSSNVSFQRFPYFDGQTL